MAMQFVLRSTFLLLLTCGLAAAAPPPPPNAKLAVETLLVFHTPLESDRVVTWTTGSKLFAMELEPS